MKMNTVFAVTLVFVGCCSNVVFLEVLVRLVQLLLGLLPYIDYRL